MALVESSLSRASHSQKGFWKINKKIFLWYLTGSNNLVLGLFCASLIEFPCIDRNSTLLASSALDSQCKAYASILLPRKWSFKIDSKYHSKAHKILVSFKAVLQLQKMYISAFLRATYFVRSRFHRSQCNCIRKLALHRWKCKCRHFDKDCDVRRRPQLMLEHPETTITYTVEEVAEVSKQSLLQNMPGFPTSPVSNYWLKVQGRLLVMYIVK